MKWKRRGPLNLRPLHAGERGQILGEPVDRIRIGLSRIRRSSTLHVSSWQWPRRRPRPGLASPPSSECHCANLARRDRVFAFDAHRRTPWTTPHKLQVQGGSSIFALSGRRCRKPGVHSETPDGFMYTARRQSVPRKGWRNPRQTFSIIRIDTGAGRGTMKRQAVLAAVLSLALGSCGVYGPKSNDIGGIIPWSPEAELNALNIAQSNCSRFNKFAAITSVHRVYGDYIGYECWWRPPRGSRRHIY